MSAIDTVDELKMENTALQQRIAELEARIAAAHNGNGKTRADEMLHLCQFSIDRAAESIFWIAPDAHFCYANDTVCRALGYTREELQRMSINHIDPDFPMEHWHTTWQETKRLGVLSIESRHRRKDGSTFPVQITANFLEYNGQEYLCVFARDITERKQTEEVMKRYATIIEATTDGISMADTEQNIMMMNEACRRMVGLDEIDFSGFKIPQLHPKWAYELVRQEGIPIALRDGFWRGETALRHLQTGKEIPVSHVILAHKLADGSIDFFSTIMRDLTEQKEAERTLKQSHDMLTTVMDSLDSLVYVADMETYEMLYMNKFGRDVFGEIDGRRCWQILQQDLPGPCEFCTNDYLLDARDNPKPPYKWDFQNTINGRWYSITDQAIRWTDGRLVRMEIATDIHDIKQTASELRTFKALVENALDGIVVTTMDATVQFANQSFQHLSGFGEQAIGTQVLDFYPPDVKPDIEQQVMPAIMNSGEWQGILELLRPDRSRWPAHHSAFTIKDEHGQVVALGNILRDVTAQQQAEAERLRLQQQIIDAQQAAIHELSTPLLPISKGVVALPLVGTVDSSRAQQVMETLLEGIAQYQAHIAIIDVTGVKVVDTQVAQALVQTAQAVKLLGAQVILTGIQPQIAQTLVHLGADLGGIATQSTLESGIAYALIKA